MNRSTLQQKLARGTGGGLGVGIVLWVFGLVRAALVLRGQINSAYYDIKIGPLVLNTLSKHAIDDGHVVGFNFGRDILLYLILCCAVGLLWGGVSYYYHIRVRPLQE